jgi:hypothetical protein
MPRARLLKPGFFKNEELLELPFEGRLLFAGLWTLADRTGHLEDRPKRIKIELFPADDVDVGDLLDNLSARGFIHRYTANGVALIHIPSFPKHQSPHKNEPASTVPACDCESLGEAPILDGDGPYLELAPEPHGASTVQAPDEPSSRPAVTGNRITVTGSGNTLSERAGADAPSERPVPPPKKTVVTEEWLTDEREVVPEQWPPSGFWSFDRVLADRMNQPYYRKAIDKRAYIHGQLENAAERWADEGSKSNGRDKRDEPKRTGVAEKFAAYG